MSVYKRVFSVGFGPGLDSMSPARSWRSASHDAGSHDWLPPKNWGPGPPERQDKVDTICTVPLDCGTPTTRRLYPLGALFHHHHHRRVIKPLSSIFLRKTLLCR